jgi:hypothetical protein
MDVDHSKMWFHLVHVCTLKEISHHHKFLQDDLLFILRKCITPSRMVGGGSIFELVTAVHLWGSVSVASNLYPKISNKCYCMGKKVLLLIGLKRSTCFLFKIFKPITWQFLTTYQGFLQMPYSRQYSILWNTFGPRNKGM